MVLLDMMIILVKTYSRHDDAHDSDLDVAREEELLKLARWTW